MQNKKNIHPLIRFIILLILLFMTAVCKSIYLMIFLILLALVFMFLSNKKIKEYISFLLDLKIIFIIAVLLLLLFSKFLKLNIFICIIKLIISLLYFMVFKLNINFYDAHQIVYYILLPLKKLNKRIDILSYNITLSLKFIYTTITSNSFNSSLKDEFYKSKNYNLIFPKILYSLQKTNEYENYLKISMYKFRKNKINMISKLLLTLFIILFVFSIIKEVIL